LSAPPATRSAIDQRWIETIRADATPLSCEDWITVQNYNSAGNWHVVCWLTGRSQINEASRDHIAEENFAFPKERKEPIHDAAHVRNAIARFNQVKGVSDAERDAAWKRIKSAAKKHSVELNEKDWRELNN